MAMTPSKKKKIIFFGDSITQMGINKGDVILQVGRQVINSPSDFNKALSLAKSGDQIRLLIQNAQSTGIYVLDMP